MLKFYFFFNRIPAAEDDLESSISIDLDAFDLLTDYGVIVLILILFAVINDALYFGKPMHTIPITVLFFMWFLPFVLGFWA